MPTLKPYPHYEINVKDNSIYRFSVDEILPVHRPLWILRTQEGPVGVPVWCATASDLKKKFGEQTLNLANKKFMSPQTLYLNKIMSYDGAFIVRALDKTAKYATAILEVVVEDAEIVQFETDNDPLSTTYGQPKIDNDPDSESYGKYIAKLKEDGTPDTEPGLKLTYRIREAEKDEDLEKIEKKETDNGTVYPILALIANSPGSYGNDLAFRFFYKDSENSAPNTALYKSIFNCFTVSRRENNESTTNIIFDTYGRGYNTFSADPECTDPESGIRMDMDSVLTSSYDTESAEGTEFPYTVYTYEDNLKTIGEQLKELETASSLAISEFGYTSKAEMNGYQINLLSGTNIKGFPYAHLAISGRNDVDPSVEYTYTKTADNEKFERNTVYYERRAIHDSIAYKYVRLVEGVDYKVGDVIVENYHVKENVEAYVPTTDTKYQANKTYYILQNDEYVVFTNYPVGSYISAAVYEKSSVEKAVSTVYKRSEADHSKSYDDQNERVLLDKDVDLYLVGGTEGGFQTGEGDAAKEIETAERDNLVDKFTYDFLKLRINPQIVDKFRYPFTHIYDCGYSMTTKYAMIDFLDIRDDVGVELSTQALFSGKWATGFAREIKLNDQAKDIANGLVLRERALLMKESVLNGTECMRASIYTQAGVPIGSTLYNTVLPVAANYADPVPFTLWSAVQHAMYGNTNQMSAQEPRGLPYSYNEMFRSWNWTNYSEPMKEKTWNAGLNYCQYADMKRIFYPALRTVYREETSVLVDQWVVDALIYTKHECRKAWAKFSGRNDKQAIIEDAIKNYLEATLADLYNGKYGFSVDVYKTEEEQKIGYVEHVKLRLEFPATMRVIVFDIEVNREGFTPEESEA